MLWRQTEYLWGPVSIRRWVHVLDTQKFPSFPRIRYLLSVWVVNYCVVCLCFDYHENYTLELSALWFSVCLTKEVNEIISGSPVSTVLSRQRINRILFIYVSCIKPKFFPRICMFTGLIMLAQHTFANLLSVNCWNLEISLLLEASPVPEAVEGAGRGAAAEGVSRGCTHPCQQWKCQLNSKWSIVPG